MTPAYVTLAVAAVLAYVTWCWHFWISGNRKVRDAQRARAVEQAARMDEINRRIYVATVLDEIEHYRMGDLRLIGDMARDMIERGERAAHAQTFDEMAKPDLDDYAGYAR